MFRDASFDPAFRPYLRQRLAGMEADAGADDWKSNGFLAGWTAMKVMVSEGRDGWTRMLSSYNRDEAASIERCRIAAAVDACPREKKIFKDASYPAALKDYLARHGYPVADLAVPR